MTYLVCAPRMRVGFRPREQRILITISDLVRRLLRGWVKDDRPNH